MMTFYIGINTYKYLLVLDNVIIALWLRRIISLSLSLSLSNKNFVFKVEDTLNNGLKRSSSAPLINQLIVAEQGFNQSIIKD